MSVDADIFTALKSLVANRVYPVDFPQSESLMTWPAIRYSFVSIVPPASVCGDVGDTMSDIRVQIDVVATSADAMRSLRTSVLTAMQSFTPSAVNENSVEVFDAETKTYRAILDFMIYQ